MMKRTKLADRVLPVYSSTQEIMNTLSHVLGGLLGLSALALCLMRSANHGSISGVISSAVYGLSMIMLYAMSSIYHGLPRGRAKKVMQVIDHCTIYLLIAGSYTPVMVCAMVPVYPVIGWSILAAVWGLAVLAATLTAIDLKAYRVFSMTCYIAMGWCIVLFLPQLLQVLDRNGFRFLLAGGLSYTAGAILYGLGKKHPWMHTVFHVFVVLGSWFQFLCIYLYVL